jgi:RHS repeat-associated protein
LTHYPLFCYIRLIPKRVLIIAYAYTPFGEIAGSIGSLYNPFTYVGEFGVMSEGSNIYYMKNRYYDAATGRFIQKDPIGVAGGQTNLYAYVGGNPVERIDPVGLCDNIESGTYDISKNQLPVNLDAPASDFEMFIARSILQFSPAGNVQNNVVDLAASIYKAIYNKGIGQDVVKNIIFLAPYHIGNVLNVLDDYLEKTTGQGFRIDIKPVASTKGQYWDPLNPFKGIASGARGRRF